VARDIPRKSRREEIESRSLTARTGALIRVPKVKNNRV
jgi:hypothetical protein